MQETKLLNPTRKNNRRELERELPRIPDKRYFTISEVGYLCHVKPHVLRYWEQEFPQLRPSKRRGNRRYYQQEDILKVRKIRQLLYEEGFTIEGARSQLMGDSPASSKTLQTDAVVQKMIKDLEGILEELKVADT